MSKHTPGPWRITDDFITIWTDNGDEAADHQLADLSSEGSPEIDAETSVANARLMAAAPDLLYVLEDLLQTVGHLEREADYDFGNVRAVIAHAKGEV